MHSVKLYAARAVHVTNGYCAGAEAQREVSSAPLPNVVQYSKDAASKAQQAVRRSRTGLNRLSAGLSRLGASLLSGFQHSQSSAQQRSSAPGAVGTPQATFANSQNGKMQSRHTAASNRSASGSSGSPPAAAAPPLPPIAVSAAKPDTPDVDHPAANPSRAQSSRSLPGAAAGSAATSPSAAGEVDGHGGITGGQGHDRSVDAGEPVADADGAVLTSAVGDADAGLGSGGYMEDVSPGFWPRRLHESIKVRLVACYICNHAVVILWRVTSL